MVREYSTVQTERGDRSVWTVLTGNGTQVQVVPDHLLQLVVQGAFLKLQTEVVTQISIQHLAWGGREECGSVQQLNYKDNDVVQC